MAAVPNFLYIGPDKAGSTWLHETLSLHPEVYLSPAKDLYFFDRYFDRGVEWYAQYFKDRADEPVVGEVCQDYLFDSRAPARIKETLGDPRLMVTLRDPADRAFSSYLYMRKHGRGAKTFKETLKEYPKLLDHGRYGSLLRPYRELFDPEDVHVAVFDDLQEDPQAFLDQILDWLGVSPMSLPEGADEKRLPASRARFVPAAWLARQAAVLVRALNGASLVGRVKRSSLTQKVLYVPLDKNVVTMSAEDRDWVREQLRPEVRDVEDMYGLDLISRWGW